MVLIFLYLHGALALIASGDSASALESVIYLFLRWTSRQQRQQLFEPTKTIAIFLCASSFPSTIESLNQYRTVRCLWVRSHQWRWLRRQQVSVSVGSLASVLVVQQTPIDQLGVDDNKACEMLTFGCCSRLCILQSAVYHGDWGLDWVFGEVRRTLDWVLRFHIKLCEKF